MITRLIAPDRERIFDDEIGRFVETSAIPCHRCGVCCERWQPLISAAEADRIAAYLGLSAARFAQEYTTTYPFDDDRRLVRRQGNGCLFLRRDALGLAACAVHPARPDACAAWTASLVRRECVDGLSRFGPDARLIPLASVYSQPAERAAFAAVVRGESHDDP